jgi:hypothetical protein
LLLGDFVANDNPGYTTSWINSQDNFWFGRLRLASGKEIRHLQDEFRSLELDLVRLDFALVGDQTLVTKVFGFCGSEFALCYS